MVEISTIVQTSLATVTGVGLTLTDTWQVVIGDRIAAYRLKNAVALQSKVEAELKKSGLKLNAAKVPDRYAFAWFEEATKQDEDEIQDIFAKLLARAAAENEDALDRRLLDIVSRFTPDDAKVFKSIYDGLNWKYINRVKRNYIETLSWYRVQSLAKEYGAKSADRPIEHLIALGLLSQSFDLNSREIGGAINMAVLTNRAPDVSNFELKDEAQSTVTGISLYLALYPLASDEAEQQPA